MLPFVSIFHFNELNMVDHRWMIKRSEMYMNIIIFTQYLRKYLWSPLFVPNMSHIRYAFGLVYDRNNPCSYGYPIAIRVSENKYSARVIPMHLIRLFGTPWWYMYIRFYNFMTQVLKYIIFYSLQTLPLFCEFYYFILWHYYMIY